MYIELLKQLYYNERKKLEGMWVYKQESKLRILELRKSVLEKTRSRLMMNEVLGRNDIAEEVKDSLLRDGKNEDKFKERLDKKLGAELADIENSQEQELKNTRYSAEEFADYLLQLEKVALLEDAISEARLFPEEVYLEQVQLNEKQEVSS